MCLFILLHILKVTLTHPSYIYVLALEDFCLTWFIGPGQRSKNEQVSEMYCFLKVCD